MATLTGAVIAAVALLVVAIGTQIELARREARTRAYERRRAALVDLQDALVAARGRLREYGTAARAADGVANPVLEEATRRFGDARDLVVVTVSRVEAEWIRALAERWLADAEQRFVSVQDVAPRTESDDWDALHRIIGRALASKSGLVREDTREERRDER